MTGICARGSSPQAALHAVVRVAADIRQVVDHARLVNLTALNAMLSSRNADGRAIGFGVVTAELRNVAAHLVDTMDLLTAEVSRVVRGVALRARREQTRRHLERAAQAGNGECAWLSEAWQRIDADVAQTEATLARQHEQLARLAQRAQRSCEMGLVLSNNARIEAAYGGPLAPRLRLVAEQLGDTIRAVSSSLAAVQKDLNEATR